MAVSFADYERKHRYSDEFDIDWQPLIERGFVTVYSLHDIGTSLRAIERLLDGWNELQGGMRVVTRDGDRRDQITEDQRQQRKADKRRGPSNA